MLISIVALSLLSVIFGLLLGYAAVRFKVQGNPIVDAIDALLPQTQCGQCSYPGCRPYAAAIANQESDINQCPPGGEVTIKALADLLGREAKPLSSEHRPEHRPEHHLNNNEESVKTVAVIDEQMCIGCTLCIQVCPTDAILGATKQMHTVIALECTGCDLCLAPCPVDCIEMVPVIETTKTWKAPYPKTSQLIEQLRKAG
ncbi:MAG: electron transport complex subunit RsxB [Gammaproteobacteria bacterium]|nr:electron transport complex subunit RsxB [Gammaproteobacteria bacterium]